jgi:tRNA-specific 2-thiouridylase
MKKITRKGATLMRALIAMSGGVDSSVAALLTMQQGFNCIGATMHLHDSGCAADAAAVADKLGIPFYEFDCRAEFCQRIKDHFVRSYEEGLTPNPCIECNRYMKFGRLLEIAESLDCEYIVTGHYAQIDQDPSSGRYRLLKAADPGKDQSYFLCRLTQYQLAHTLFPLGQLTKAAARQIAEENGFMNAKKQDSQDICFVPDGNYMEFLQQYTGKQYAPGAFLDNRGNVVGQHLGAVAYTIGQRKGLGLAMGEPVYVCDKDMKANTVTVGSNDTLFRRELQAHDWNWISIPSLAEPIRCKAKTRSRMIEQPATAYPMADGSVRVEFDELQRAITPGQAVVLYDGNSVVGAGTIVHDQ